MMLAFQLSDLVTVPFGWLLGILYQFTTNYGVAMILFAIFSGRGIYLDIALVGALFGIVDTMLVGRYLEGRL